MKIDESVIDKVLDNKAAPGEARKVAGWFVTEEGRKYLSGRLDREMEELAEEVPEDVRLPFIPGMKMKQRFMSEIKRERGRRSVGRKWMWVAAVLLPFVFLSVSLLFLVNRTGIFSETEYAEISVPYGEQMRVILQDGSIVHLNSDSRLRYPKQFGLFNRTVELWGEGYFNVARDENRPFKVDLQGVEVIAFEKEKQLLLNTYPISGLNDSCYYLLNIWQQAGYNQEDDQLYICGNNRVPQWEELPLRLKKYIRKLFIINPQMEFNDSAMSRIKEISFDMLSLISCE